MSPSKSSFVLSAPGELATLTRDNVARSKEAALRLMQHVGLRWLNLAWRHWRAAADAARARAQLAAATAAARVEAHRLRDDARTRALRASVCASAGQ